MAYERIWITVALMSATVIQTLDMTIVNVALPNMSGELGATPDSISWVVTTYMMAAAVFMPLTGFLTDRLGRKRYLAISVGGFVITSGLCGIAETLPQMVLFRLLQGIFGASLVPLSQAIMVASYPVESRARALAIWGMGVMVAPIIGPTLGGYLTETLSWRWNFYINLPVGLASLMLVLRFVPDTPVKPRSMDWLGFGALAVAIASAQLVLDRGAEKDWFDSTLICAATICAGASLIVFLWHSLSGRSHPLFDLTVLKDRNLAVACFIMLVSGLGVFGGQFLAPLFLENLLGFPSLEAGFYVMPRGIGSFLAMSLVGRIGNRIDPRWLLTLGILLSWIGALLLTRLTPQTSGQVLWVPLLVQGFGMGFIFVPLATLAFATIPAQKTVEGAGIYSLMRSFGSSIGVSIAATYLNYTAKLHWADLRGAINPFNPQVHAYLQSLGPSAAGLFDASGTRLNQLGATVMANVVQQQAMTKAFVSTYWLIVASLTVMFPLLPLIKKAGTRAAPMESVAE